MTSSVAAGDIFAGYRIERRIGAGGMGEVFLAEHPRLPRKDALKLLSPGIRGDGDFRRRFVREAELSAGLRHPHIVPIYDCGDVDGRLWISMAYIEGPDAGTLASSYENRFMPTELVIDITNAIAGALDYAHERGLLHRDVKPGNILVDESSRPQAYLADFGIARPQDDNLGLTATGGFIGSVPYCAPEQFDDPRTLTAAVDQYQLACTAFELLTGAPPFGSPEPLAAMRQHLTADPPDPGYRRPGLPHTLAGVFRRALAKDPSHRYPTCADFADALAESLRSASVPEGARQAPNDWGRLGLPVVGSLTDTGDRPEEPNPGRREVLGQSSAIDQHPGPARNHRLRVRKVDDRVYQLRDRRWAVLLGIQRRRAGQRHGVADAGRRTVTARSCCHESRHLLCHFRRRTVLLGEQRLRGDRGWDEYLPAGSHPGSRNIGCDRGVHELLDDMRGGRRQSLLLG